MFKRIITIAITAAIVTVLFSTSAPKAEAQVAYCSYCCDAYGVARCSGPAIPCGFSCVCYGLGSGYAC
jgi:hypothetical protein